MVRFIKRNMLFTNHYPVFDCQRGCPVYLGHSQTPTLYLLNEHHVFTPLEERFMFTWIYTTNYVNQYAG